MPPGPTRRARHWPRTASPARPTGGWSTRPTAGSTGSSVRRRPVLGDRAEPPQALDVAGPQQDVFTAFGTVTGKDGLVPYLDYATPTFADTLGAALQDLLAEKATPQEFLATLEKDYKTFTESD